MVFVDSPADDASVTGTYVFTGANLVDRVCHTTIQLTGILWLLKQVAQLVKPKANRVDACADSEISKKLKLAKATELLLNAPIKFLFLA